MWSDSWIPSSVRQKLIRPKPISDWRGLLIGKGGWPLNFSSETAQIRNTPVIACCGQIGRTVSLPLVYGRSAERVRRFNFSVMGQEIGN